MRVDGQVWPIEGFGNGPISAFCDALNAGGVKVRVLDYTEHALSAGSDAQAAAYVEVEIDGGTLGRGRGCRHHRRLHACRPLRRQPRRPRLTAC